MCKRGRLRMACRGDVCLQNARCVNLPLFDLPVCGIIANFVSVMANSVSDIYYHGPVVALDLDDTLYSEREHAVAAYRAVAAMPDIASPALSPRVVRVMAAALDRRENPFDALEEMLARDCIATLADTAQRVQVYRSCRPRRLTLYPDARKLLDALRDRGVRCAIVTDGRSATQRGKIRALGIEDRFHPGDILISGETGHDKTEPDNFTALVHHYPEASRFIYIGDNPAKDFDMPAMLGWDTYCLRSRPGNIHPQGECSNAVMVESLTDILDCI